VKLFLDNCMPYRSKSLLGAHEVIHARDMGWRNLTNGILLASAFKAGFDVFVTVDRNIRYQQNLERLPLTVIEFGLVKNG